MKKGETIIIIIFNLQYDVTILCFVLAVDTFWCMFYFNFTVAVCDNNNISTKKPIDRTNNVKALHPFYFQGEKQ
jgi:hypothetical protein